MHEHPYPPFIPAGTTKLIVGTLPPPRFSTGALKQGDVHFCYGSRDGQLWPILDRLFELQLKYENTSEAIAQRKTFLTKNHIGVCDIVASAARDKVDASDLGMSEVKLRDLLTVLTRHPKIDTLLFTGGNSKNGPEYFFRKYLKDNNLTLKVVDGNVPRVHSFWWQGREVRTVSLTAPSGAANRAVGAMQAYKVLKAKNPEINTVDFRVLQYRPFFID